MIVAVKLDVGSALFHKESSRTVFILEMPDKDCPDGKFILLFSDGSRKFAALKDIIRDYLLFPDYDLMRLYDNPATPEIT